MEKRDFIYAAIILILAVCLRAGCRETKRADNLITLYESAQDSLHKERNIQGQEKASNALLYSAVADFKKMKAADSSAIGKLQRMVDKLTISATYLSNVTSNNFTAPIQYITSGDTVIIDSITYVYPQYTTCYSDKWERFSIKADKDSFAVEYKVFNEFNLVQAWKSNGIFKRKTPEVSILNLNPHTETKELQTFTVKEDKSNRLRDMLIGAAVGAITIEAIRVFNVRIPIHF